MWGKKVMDREDYTIIVGCGRLGANLAMDLAEKGKGVLVIDKDPKSFQRLPASYGGLTLEADATDLDVLSEAEIEKATAIVSVTNRDNVNIMVAQLAREWFHKERVICRLYDPERECVYRELNIDTICPSILSAKEAEKLIHEKKEVPYENTRFAGRRIS